MHELPAGTVTFLFTDIAGSTRLLREHGDAYVDLLAAHHQVVRDALERHAGVEVDTQGDAFFAAFSRASDAVEAAADIRDGLGDGPVQVRMGIHTGEPLITDEGYAGMDVHRAARISAAAHAGQIVLSRTTRDLLGPIPELRDLGEHRLKDLTEAERLFQLGDGDFPPLKSLDATNLPVTASPLLGRERELAELLGLLGDGRRLVTITGPGGTGKTRLALQAAAELAGTVADGIFWVPLGPLADPELVPTEIAQAVGAPDDLAGFLRDRELVLLLDNFEHLLAAAPTVAGLMASAPRLRVLITSRAPLRISGETEYPLDPLDPSDAAALFVERARAVGRHIDPDATVEAICARLDGLPLAIELAAARLRLFGPDALLERLEQTLPVLTGGARDAPERQQTLRATIAWSYELLGEESRQLFARLAVFSGSFPIAAAESVCDADLAELTALVDMSLVKPIGDDRLLMLETIREFARERLVDSGEEDAFRNRHAREFSRLAELAYAHRLDDEAEWSSRLDRDHDDLRAALDWLADTGPDDALEVAGALGWFWFTRGYLAEGDARLAACMATSNATGRARARVLTASGSLAARLGRVGDGRKQLENAVELWRELGEPREAALALDALGWLLVYDAGDDGASLAAFEEERAVWQELGDTAGETRALVGIGQVLVALGEVERAEALSHELLERGAGDLRTRHFAMHFLADCSLIRGDCEEAEARYRESLRAALELGDVIEMSAEVEGIAMAKAGRGEHAVALQLAASVEELYRSLGTDFHVAFWDALQDRYYSSARAALGPDAEAALARGLELPFDDAVAIALQDA